MRLAFGLLGMISTAACTNVPYAGDLPTTEDGDAQAASYRTIPDGVRPPPAGRVEPTPEPAPAPGPETRRARVGPPRIVVSRFGEVDEWGGGEGTARCPFTVEGLGFPAVSADGAKLTSFVDETLSSSDGEDELVTVRITDVASDVVEHATVAVDGNRFPGGRHCRQLWREARAQAAAVDELLATTEWRPMESLPVSGVGVWDEGAEALHERLLAQPPRDRGVEFVLQHDEAIIRIPGVAVLARTAADWAAPDQDEMCSNFMPIVEELLVERTTGVVTARVAQFADPCFCYAETLYHPLHVPPEALALIEAHSPIDDIG
jgi:hypothetical protein